MCIIDQYLFFLVECQVRVQRVLTYEDPPLTDCETDSNSTSDESSAVSLSSEEEYTENLHNTRTHRLSMSPIRKHRKRARKFKADAESDDELEILDNNRGEFTLDEVVKKARTKELQEAFSPDNMQEQVCAVCDEWCRRKDSHRVNCKKWPHWNDARARLRMTQDQVADLPEALIQQYNSAFRLFSGLWLSPRGIKSESQLILCSSCFRSLKKKNLPNPPRLAIANGFFIGQLPFAMEFSTRRLLSLAHVTRGIQINKLSGRQYLKSHTAVIKTEDAAKQVSLPNIPEGEIFRVIFAGSFTPADRLHLLRRYRVHKTQLLEAASFFRDNNWLYEDVEVNEEVVAALEDDALCPGVTEEMEEEVEGVGDVADGCAAAPALEEAEGNSEPQRPDPVDCSSLLCLKENADELLLHRRSNEFLRDSDPATILRAFPELFPFGRGGFNEQRGISVSWEGCVKHYLRLSTRAFAHHESYLLYMFDVIRRSRAMRSCHRMLEMKPDQALQTGKVSAADIDMAERFYTAKGKPPEVPPELRAALSRVTATISGVRSSMKHCWGSKEEARGWRMKAYSLCSVFGQPAIFFTWNPDDIGNLIVGAYAGYFGSELLENITAELRESASAMASAISKDPVAVVRYYEQCLEAVQRIIIGYNLSLKKPRRGGGLLGVPAAYMGCTESQQRGTIHMHMIIWLHGSVNTTTEALSKYNVSAPSKEPSAQPSVVQEKTHDFDSSIRTLVLPGWCTYFTKCLKCRQLGQTACVLRASERFPADAYESGANEKGAVVGVCPLCQHEWRYMQVIDAAKADMKTYLNGRGISDDTLANALHSTKPYDMPDSWEVSIRNKEDIGVTGKWQVAHYVLLNAILAVCMHSPNHRKGCFKYSDTRGDGCRFHIPVLTTTTAFVDGKYNLHLERPVGSEYIVAFSPAVICSMKFNHDVCVMLGCDGGARMYYCINSLTKGGVEMDNAMMVYKDVMTRHPCSNAGPEVTAATGKKRLFCMLYHQSDMMEISKQFAVLCMLRGSSWVCSHQFAPLILAGFVKYMKDEPITMLLDAPQQQSVQEVINLSDSEGEEVMEEEIDDGSEEDEVAPGNNIPEVTCQLSSQIVDYIYRPDALECCCLYQYVQSYMKVHRKPEAMVGQVWEFRAEHPAFDSHVLAARPFPLIPIVYGQRLPNTSSFSDVNETDLEAKEVYGLHLLLLFYPFRSHEDLHTEEHYYNTLMEYVSNDSVPTPARDAMNKYMLYVQDSYDSKKAAIDLAAALSVENARAANGDGVEEQVVAVDAQAPERYEDAVLQLTTGVDDALEEELVADMEELLTSVDNVKRRTKVSPEEAAACSHMTNVYMKESIAPKENMVLNSDPWKGACDKAWVDAEKLRKQVEPEEGPRDNCNPNFIYKDRRSRLEIITSALNGNHADNLDGEYYPTCASVAQRFDLNEEKIPVFESICRALLLRWKRKEEPCDTQAEDATPESAQKDHMLGILLGEGGCGKSYIIDAVKYFANMWHPHDKKERILCCAPTNMAAMGISGLTIHSLFAISRKSDKSGMVKNSKNYLLLQDCDLLFIDEFSMLKTSMLYGINEGCTTVFSTENAFGGLNVLLAGDLQQLDPIGGRPLYLPPTGDASLRQRVGYDLYRKFDTVYSLSSSVRHNADPAFSALLNRLRIGQLTDEDYMTLCSRTFCSENAQPQVLPDIVPTEDGKIDLEHFKKQSFTPFTCYNNEIRHAINKYTLECVCRARPDIKPLRLYALLNNSAGNSLPISVKSQVWRLQDHKTEFIPMLFDLVIGMPVMITNNNGKELGCVSGKVAIVAGFIIREGAELREIRSNNRNYCLPHGDQGEPDLTAVEYVLLVPFSNKSPVKCSLDDVNVIPVKRQNTYFSTVDSLGIKHRVKAQQFPIVPAYAITVTKLQGYTLDSIYITRNVLAASDYKALYVAMSRVRMLKHLNFTFLPDKQALNKIMQGSRAVMREVARLSELATK